MGFEPMTTEFRSNALTDWTIRSFSRCIDEIFEWVLNMLLNLNITNLKIVLLCLQKYRLSESLVISGGHHFPQNFTVTSFFSFFLQPPCCCFFVLKGDPILYVSSTITVQYLGKSSKIQVCNECIFFEFS